MNRASLARAFLSGDDDEAIAGRQLDEGHDLAVVGDREYERIPRLRVTEPMEVDTAEVVLVSRRHGPGFGESQVIESRAVLRPCHAREFHPAEAVRPIAKRPVEMRARGRVLRLDPRARFIAVRLLEPAVRVRYRDAVEHVDDVGLACTRVGHGNW